MYGGAEAVPTLLGTKMRTVARTGISGRFNLDILPGKGPSVIHGFPFLVANAFRCL